MIGKLGCGASSMKKFIPLETGFSCKQEVQKNCRKKAPILFKQSAVTGCRTQPTASLNDYSSRYIDIHTPRGYNGRAGD